MQKLKWRLLTLCFVLNGFTAPALAYAYPEAPKHPLIENYHGTSVADPYRWLENIDSPETKAWVEAENKLTQNYLNQFPQRAQIFKRLETLQNYPRTGVPFKAGKAYAFWKNNGLQNQSVLYYQKSLTDSASLILDPNQLSKDGTVAVSDLKFSHDGRYMAYALSQSGSDWQEVRIRDLQTGKDLPEVLKDLKFSGIAWKHDNSGFFYNRYPQPGTVPEKEQYLNNKVYWHRLNSLVSEDLEIYARPDLPELSFYPTLTEDGRFLLLYGSKGTEPENRLYYKDLQKNGPIVRLLDQADASYTVIDYQAGRFYLETDLKAPRKRIVAIDPLKPAVKDWVEIIPEQKDVLSFAQFVNHQLVTGWLHDAHSRLRVYAPTGKFEYEIALPVPGSISGITGDREDSEMLFGFTSFLFPKTGYRFDFKTRKLNILQAPEIQFDASPYTTTQVFVNSKDGTPIPIYLTHRKDLQLNGKNPVLLYGYGGFNISLTPWFSPTELLWLEQGGVYAVVNLRGGGEYGEAWHRAGMLQNKQNVFDDLIASAEWLIKQGYTQPSRLAIQGGSNGGLLVGATLLQRPDLFGAAICQVPVLDMLRYHLFTVGRYWIPEYGNAIENPEDFKFMYAYSPLHRIHKPQAHPPVLITTADHDDRVLPAHAYKFTAALQAASEGKNPVLLRVETKAGHGAGKPIQKRLEEHADIYAFLFQLFGMRLP
ncbi:S9 family peptidase [bacterium (Candidatus Blackallbacteria) CG17_big_fil_post_rev_8_21_14_2_50_48_46]|uniref:prolyl oligopeptidase n=1 Tax=bacterium (Candidatus Blackallbacteria) CG17_big_fil_post_rev_8_21_14_2_50_48_46 TaxID=2014261 RepID=A0A2M7G6L2_9BACT|nr:MAG: S9 family peptidase [bacterium (Candidatus Blackallbacteria) CG18_big_fil_WC_8_21_14_2_50_49_26]PIW17667.1 MAG: S9 family peptidase [bacterium (Candidatus Blackallbacteria) CG17_big_fil_post_rev_8_21_14_2_50_48_46]PIW50114.1 MAG: S9 family peptidase [bacterium (Candidatus Blackallbacteria) CG13_big_fil_rev_8_21_14_2_50_49_14]